MSFSTLSPSGFGQVCRSTLAGVALFVASSWMPLPLLFSSSAQAQTVFKVTTIPEEAATEQTRKFGPIVKYLESALGMKVEFTPVSDYPAAVEAMVINIFKMRILVLMASIF